MRASPSMLALALAFLPAAAQDKANPAEVVLRHDERLRKVPGVLDVSVGGVNGQMKIVVRVENETARGAIRAEFGEHLEGFPIYVLVSSPRPAAAACARCPLHCGGPGSTVSAPAAKLPPGNTRFDVTRIDDPSYANEKCDIIRKWLGLPKLKEEPRCHEIVTWTNEPMKIRWAVEQGFPHWRSKELGGPAGSSTIDCLDHGKDSHGGETLCFTWIKHKQFCPLGMKQVLKEIQDHTPSQGSRP